MALSVRVKSPDGRMRAPKEKPDVLPGHPTPATLRASTRRTRYLHAELGALTIAGCGTARAGSYWRNSSLAYNPAGGAWSVRRRHDRRRACASGGVRPGRTAPAISWDAKQPPVGRERSRLWESMVRRTRYGAVWSSLSIKRSRNSLTLPVFVRSRLASSFDNSTLVMSAYRSAAASWAAFFERRKAARSVRWIS